MKRGTVLLSLAAIALTPPAVGQAQPRDKFGLSEKTIARPALAQGKQPFSQALCAGAIRLDGDYVTFGIEFKSDEVVEPLADGRVPPGTRVGEFLEHVVGQVPQYEYEAVSSHLVSVYPVGAKDDPNDILNLRIARFDFVDTYAGEVLGYPAQYIPELRERLYPGKKLFIYAGPVVPGPKITLHLRDVTLREILNAASIAAETAPDEGGYPVGWTYRSAAAAHTEGPQFGGFFSLPPGWKRPAPSGAKAGGAVAGR